jgi:predicted secreted protein
MPTTGKIEGGLLTLYKKGTPNVKFACLTDVSVSFEFAEVDVTCHESTGSWGDFLNGRNSGTVTGNGYYDQSTSNYNFDDLFTDAVAKTKIDAVLSTAVQGDTRYEFNCVITSISASVPNKGEYTTYSFTLRVTGAPTVATNS